MASPTKHILFICSWYPNRTAPALGNFIRRHAEAAARHHRVSVAFACSDAELGDDEYVLDLQEEDQLSEARVYFPKTKHSLPLLGSLKRSGRYRKAIRLAVEEVTHEYGKPDLIHLQVIWPAAIAAIQLAEEMNVPLLISEHWSGYLPEDGNYKGRLLKYFTRRAVKRATHITAVSERMIEAMRAHGLENRYSLLPNVVDTALFRPGTTASRSGLRLLHVSMLVDREKNISGMLHVMEKLKNETGIRLDIVGDGPERAALEKMAEQSGLLGKTVFFHGFADAAAVAAQMQQADALLLFSHFEGMPVTIIEAQSCGLPVIATRTGAIPQMVGETQGILVSCGDEPALAGAILEMKNKQGQFDREAIRSHAIAHYSMDAVGERLNELYTSILSRFGR